MSSGRPRRHRLIAALLLGELLAAFPIAASAAPPASHRELSVAIAVSTPDCTAVSVDFTVDWRGIHGGADANISSVELRAVPGGYFLTSAALEPGHKTDKQKGQLIGQLVRESGYFDSQTYTGLSYELVVNLDDQGTYVQSNAVAIPSCVPLSPTSGPAAGGTSVTIFGGGTFGGPIFTMASSVTLGGATIVSPTSVATDGSSLTFVTSAGTPNTCVSVATDPGLPFPLPDFCYGS
jgi:hypothetical protein